MLTGLYGLWGRAVRVEGILLTPGHEKHKELFIYIFFCYILMPLQLE